MVTEFTPLASFGGGVLIGLGAIILMATIGRVFGATGVLTGFIRPFSKDDWSWRAATLLGMLIAPSIYKLVMGQFPEIQVPSTTLMLAVGGVLVGIGVTYGSGCTSGHGVCGNARLSVRSMTATITFMITAGITVYILRHILGAY